MNTYNYIAVLTLGAALFSLPARAAEASFQPPAKEVILQKLKKEHPRLLMTAEDLSNLQARIGREKVLQEWVTELRGSAAALLKEPPSKYEIPDGKRLLATSRRVMSRVYTLSMMYKLEGDRRLAERAWTELEAASQFKDWNPSHFLDTAEMTHAFAIGYDWLYDYWTPARREVLRKAIIEKGLSPSKNFYKPTGLSGFARVHHNWNQVCNGGMGIGALAIADTDPDLARDILHAVVRSLPLAMNEFAPDGAWNEGPGYWNYATMYNVAILAAMETALGTDFGLSRIPGFQETGYFPLYITGPLEKTFNYADGSETGFAASQLFWLSRRFNQPVLTWRQTQKAQPTALDILWWSPKAMGPEEARLPRNKHFRGVEVVTMRSAWEDPKAAFVGFKAGDNKANHGHLDLGSFVFDAQGTRWAMDVGGDNYNLPGYFGDKRWTYYRNRAEGQNVLVINPDQEPDQEPAAFAKITTFKSTPGKSFAVADLTPAYAKHASRVLRGVALLDGKQILIQDEVECPAAADIWWFMHTGAEVKISDSGKEAALKSGETRLTAKLLSPAGARFQVMGAKPLATTPDPAGQRKNSNVRKLTVNVKEARSQIVVLLTPEVPGMAAPAQPTVRLLAEW